MSGSMFVCVRVQYVSLLTLIVSNALNASHGWNQDSKIFIDLDFLWRRNGSDFANSKMKMSQQCPFEEARSNNTVNLSTTSCKNGTIIIYLLYWVKGVIVELLITAQSDYYNWWPVSVPAPAVKQVVSPSIFLLIPHHSFQGSFWPWVLTIKVKVKYLPSLGTHVTEV